MALAYGAVDKILGARARGAGLFVLAHSGGLRTRPADGRGDDPRAAALLGLELAGTGLRYHDAALDILRNASATHRPPGLRELLWEPTELYPAEVLSGITNSSTGAPYEADR